MASKATLQSFELCLPGGPIIYLCQFFWKLSHFDFRLPFSLCFYFSCFSFLSFVVAIEIVTFLWLATHATKTNKTLQVLLQMELWCIVTHLYCATHLSLLSAVMRSDHWCQNCTNILCPD